MDYNTSRKKLACPEYGRNIQLLVDYAKTIKDPEELDRTVKAIIQIMGSMNPQLRDIPDFKHKLWDHLNIMADYELNIKSPYPAPEKEDLDAKPAKLEYNGGELLYPEYGRIIEKLIKKAITIKDPARQNELNRTISNHIKKTNLLWGKEISDEDIFHILKDISNGQLQVQENIGKLIDGQGFINNNKQKKNNVNGNVNNNQGGNSNPMSGNVNGNVFNPNNQNQGGNKNRKNKNKNRNKQQYW